MYCMPHGVQKKTHDEILRDEEIIEIVTNAVSLGITKIRITGGEPLVRKGIYGLIQKIKQLDGVKEIAITTNGTLLIGNVKKLKDSGVSRINFSLDTLDDSKFKKITQSELSFDYHQLILELIEHQMQPIKINTVLLKGINDDEINDFIALANQYDITVRFIELMPIGHLAFSQKEHFISKQEILEKHQNLVFESNDKVTEYYSVIGHKGKIGFINPISDKFCKSCNRIRLTADGYLLPCLHNNQEINVKNSNQEELLMKLRAAINAKPESHQLDQTFGTKSSRNMNKIGG